MGFVTYRQNNSGGGFDIDVDRGISVNVIVEAGTVSEANERAQSLGIYFNGCDDGMDCPCCGDRWYEPYGEDSVTEVPETGYGTSLFDYGTERDPAVQGGYRMTPMRWAGDLPDVFVHLKDGRKFGFVLTKDGVYVYDGDPSDLAEALPAASTKEIEG